MTTCQGSSWLDTFSRRWGLASSSGGQWGGTLGEERLKRGEIAGARFWRSFGVDHEGLQVSVGVLSAGVFWVLVEEVLVEEREF